MSLESTVISATSEYVHSDVHETVAHHLGDGRWVVSDMPGLVIDRTAAIRHVMWKETERGRQIMYEQARETVTPEKARAKVQALLAEARAVLAVAGPVTDSWLAARMDEANYLLCLTQLVLGRLEGERGAVCVLCQRSDRSMRQVGVSPEGLLFACVDGCMESLIKPAHT
ncbi:hypothetical protein [Nonomuraea aridisoli]|uniref:Uncharacterized protein n=1 Tax=Nonomuraea aridisoli TaxID=2070368 RepID=A0A2W2EDJ5_9ACTN|nr:hypothetical protein [Nonomuraea aridisoli]PZG20583.1 hypothetical protein C1J01_08755 [Nonomuraea aridisoli]